MYSRYRKKRNLSLAWLSNFQRAQFHLHEGRKELLWNQEREEIKRYRKSNAVFFSSFQTWSVTILLGHHSIRGKNWGNHFLWLWWVNGFQSFRWYPTLTALCAELYKQIMVKALLIKISIILQGSHFSMLGIVSQ